MLSNQIACMGVVPVLVDHPPAVRLQGHINTWTVITKDPWVLNTIGGYQINFLSEFHQRALPHTPQYSAEQRQLIVVEVKELLGKGAIKEVHNSRGGFWSNLFLVAKKDGGQRPVINLNVLNSFVQTEHFKMEGIHTLRDSQSRGLAGKSGSKGCILRNPNPPGPLSISQVFLSRQMLSVPMPPIRPVVSSMGLYQDHQARISSPSGDGGTIDSIHRPCASPGGVQGTSRVMWRA